MTEAERIAAIPKARLLYIKWRCDPPILRPNHWWAKFRLANAMFVWIGPFEIGWRMPWLMRSAKAIYPHLFSQTTHTKDIDDAW